MMKLLVKSNKDNPKGFQLTDPTPSNLPQIQKANLEETLLYINSSAEGRDGGNA